MSKRTTKSVTYAYPTSDLAKEWGYPLGCWIVQNIAGDITVISCEQYGYRAAAYQAFALAEALPGNYHPSSKFSKGDIMREKLLTKTY